GDRAVGGPGRGRRGGAERHGGAGRRDGAWRPRPAAPRHGEARPDRAPGTRVPAQLVALPRRAPPPLTSFRPSAYASATKTARSRRDHTVSAVKPASRSHASTSAAVSGLS